MCTIFLFFSAVEIIYKGNQCGSFSDIYASGILVFEDVSAMYNQRKTREDLLMG